MRVRLAPLLVAPLLAAFVAVAACSNEAEGEPCSTDNGNNDCQDGLECIPPRNQQATNATDVCCPPNPAQATTPACTVNGSVEAGNPAPPDGSTMPESATTSDGKAEGASDSPSSEASSEGSSDAPADGSHDSASSGDAADGGAG
jgi:hypothetical protein